MSNAPAIPAADNASATNPITLTPRALQAVVKIVADEGLDVAKVRLRVGVKGGGCSGFSYILDLTENQRDSDEAWQQEGVTVICDPKSLLYLSGTRIDYKEEFMTKGFVFENPNATSSCGCGSSFSA